jgi:hypothetical protein
MPGMGELMEGAIQQAPQPERHSMTHTLCKNDEQIVTAETIV